jgi:desulfoferrodoxin (superoxide reductase-like protein)
MFYYIEVHLLAHYIQWIKMHGETVELSAYVPPSMSATKFRTHTKQQAKLQFCVS